MKCQILSFRENKKKKIINLSSAELAQKVVKVTVELGQEFYLIF